MKLTYEKKNEMSFIGYHTEIKPELFWHSYMQSGFYAIKGE